MRDDGYSLPVPPATPIPWDAPDPAAPAGLIPTSPTLPMFEPTIPLADFLAAYEKDDNEWWRLSSGDHMNLFDEAIGALDEIASGSTHCAPGINGAVMIARRALGRPDALAGRGSEEGS